MKLHNKKMVGKQLAGVMQLSLYKKHFKTSVKMSKSTGEFYRGNAWEEREMGTFNIYTCTLKVAVKFNGNYVWMTSLHIASNGGMK